MARIVLLTKQDRFSRAARGIAEQAFPGAVATFAGSVGDPDPDLLETASPALLLSFLSPWIVRKQTLDRCGRAINFHPGPVEYPGIGCYNFALYEEARDYGAVCHHMLPRVDTGPIVAERRFPLLAGDTVETLKLKTMRVLLAMFRDTVQDLAAGRPLPAAATHWTRAPFTRRQMEALKALEADMPPREIARRVRATVYPGYPGPVLRRRDGSSFAYPVPQRPALA